MTTMMKRCIALAMSAALALSITACGSNSKPSASQSGSASDASTVLGEDVQIPNPWKDFESLEEAVKAVGFDFVAPDATKLPIRPSQTRATRSSRSCI